MGVKNGGVQINAQFLFFWTMPLGMKFFVLVRLLYKYFCSENCNLLKPQLLRSIKQRVFIISEVNEQQFFVRLTSTLKCNW